jgi:hypothetical protein
LQVYIAGVSWAHGGTRFLWKELDFALKVKVKNKYYYLEAFKQF